MELIEVDAEGAVVGSMICDPEVMQALAADIDPDWFADPGVRLFLDTALKLHRDGHKVTAPVVLASISTAADAGPGITRASFMIRLSDMAMPVAYLSGPISILKDRWARRVLAREAEQLRQVAGSSETDPFDAGEAAIAGLDGLAVVRRTRDAGSLIESTDQLFEALANPDKAAPASMGIATLDRALGGYMPEQLYVIGGRPGMGKSAFMCSSLRRTAESGDGVLIFSLEMTRNEIAARCLSDAMSDLRAPFYGAILRNEYATEWSDALIAARERFKGLPLRIDASPRLNMSEIAARARAHKARLEASGKRLGVVCIDHMGLVDPSSRYAGNKVAETGEVSRAGKILAKQLGCCVVLLAQLNRGVEDRDDKRPSLADLRWSGDIEQDADAVAFLFRESYYLQQRPDCAPETLAAARHRLEFLIRKNRNGEAVDVPLWCSIGHSSIKEAR